jgi:hypothetical protein
MKMNDYAANLALFLLKQTDLFTGVGMGGCQPQTSASYSGAPESAGQLAHRELRTNVG